MSQYKCKCPNCSAENIVNDAQLAKQCEQCGRIIILEDYTLTDSEKDQKIDYAYQLLAKSSLSTIQEAQGYLDQFTDEEIGKDLHNSINPAALLPWPPSHTPWPGYPGPPGGNCAPCPEVRRPQWRCSAGGGSPAGPGKR